MKRVAALMGRMNLDAFGVGDQKFDVIEVAAWLKRGAP